MDVGLAPNALTPANWTQIRYLPALQSPRVHRLFDPSLYGTIIAATAILSSFKFANMNRPGSSLSRPILRCLVSVPVWRFLAVLFRHETSNGDFPKSQCRIGTLQEEIIRSLPDWMVPESQSQRVYSP